MWCDSTFVSLSYGTFRQNNRRYLFQQRCPEGADRSTYFYCVDLLFVAKTLLTCQTSDLTRPPKVCCGIWRHGVSSRSFKACQLQVGPPRVGHACSAHPTDAPFDCDLGNLEAKSNRWTSNTVWWNRQHGVCRTLSVPVLCIGLKLRNCNYSN